MRILFVEGPPTLDWVPESHVSTGGRRHPSLNVTGELVYSYLNLSAAAVARHSGHDIFYIHCQTEGVTIPKLRKMVEKLQPDVTVIYIEHIKKGVDFEIAKIAKQVNSLSVFVGPFATALGKELLVSSHVDMIAKREYDYTITEIANCLETKKGFSGVKGIIYKNGKRVIDTGERGLIKDLDKLPIPAYDLVDLKKFFEVVFLRFPTATVISSRGCPYRCVFCAFPNTIYSHEFRAQSPQRVLDEARYLQDEFGVKEIRYDDDTFEVSSKRVFDICNLFRKEGIDMYWAPQCRPGLMTRKLVTEMAKAGCVRILFGVESGDDKILKLINKGTTIAEIARGVKLCKNAGIDVLNCIIFGFMYDTMETMRKTLDFACKLNAEFTQFSIATPLPGTPYYDAVKSKGYLVSDWENCDSFHKAGVNFPQLSSDDITCFLKEAYSKYYLRKDYASLMLKRAFMSNEKFSQTLRMAKAYLDRKKEGWM
jgi:radical SAM superfamily enzyme YgiQ (UPF0313 family)